MVGEPDHRVQHGSSTGPNRHYHARDDRLGQAAPEERGHLSSECLPGPKRPRKPETAWTQDGHYGPRSSRQRLRSLSLHPSLFLHSIPDSKIVAIHARVASASSSRTSSSPRPDRLGTWKPWSAPSTTCSVALSPNPSQAEANSFSGARASRVPWRKSMGTPTSARWSARSAPGLPGGWSGKPKKRRLALPRCPGGAPEARWRRPWRSCAPPHGLPAGKDGKAATGDFMRCRQCGPDGLEQDGAVVRPSAPLFHVGKLVPEGGDASLREPLRHSLHEAVAYTGSGPVAEDQEAARVGGLQQECGNLSRTRRRSKAVLDLGVQPALRLRADQGIPTSTENRLWSQSRWSTPASAVSSREIVKRSTTSGSDDRLISTV